MRAILNAVSLYLRTSLSWQACRTLTTDPHYMVVERDGLLYIEPRETRRRGAITCKGWIKPR